MFKYISSFVVLFHLILQGVFDRFWSFFYKRAMGYCGKNVNIKPCTSVFKGIGNLYIGNYVSIPRYATIFCTEARLIIGNKVIFGPSPTIVTGNHRIDVVGKYIVDTIVKLPENDKDVIIEDDVWIGGNVTILMGVTIGRGVVVAAGSIVNKSFPPYSIIGGVPAKILKYRFTVNQILEHEISLYPEEKRLSRDFLELIQNND